MDDMGLGAFCQHSDDMQVDKLIAQFTELTANREHYEGVIRQAVRSAREKLADQEKEFNSRFLEPAIAAGA
jgi:fructose-1,6-bisphosphatase